MASARRARLVRQLVLLAIALVVVAVGAVAWSQAISGDEHETITLSDPGSTGYLLTPTVSVPQIEGNRFPDTELPDADGEPVSLAATGTPMVVNFWFAGCPPCSRELPDFAEVAAEYDGRVRFVGINTEDDADKMVEFASARGVDYELLRDEAARMATDMEVVYFPTTVFVDGEGRIVATTGPIDDDELRSHVEQLVA